MKVLAPLILGFLLGNATDAVSADYTVIRQYARVVINNDADGKDIGNGSAIVIAPNYLLTVKHVTESAVVKVGKTYETAIPAKVVKTGKGDVDLALLYVPGVQCPCAELVNANPEIDQDVFHVGYPQYLGQGVQYLTKGQIQGIGGGHVITTAPIAPGSSGGGMFVRYGMAFRLAGIAKSVRTVPGKVYETPQLRTWRSAAVDPQTIQLFLIGTPVEIK